MIIIGELINASRMAIGAIVNPLDRGMMASIIAAEALAGRDDFCVNYLKGY